MSEENLFRLRVSYVKHGRLRYLGHLELIHTVERIVRRAQLPYAVTQGFSPHMKIAFSSALPVGTASDCEWYDVFLTRYVPAAEAFDALAAASPADLAPARAGYVERREPALEAALTRARYRVALTLAAPSARDAARAEEVLAAVVARREVRYLRGRKVKRIDLVCTFVGAKLAPGGGCGSLRSTRARAPRGRCAPRCCCGRGRRRSRLRPPARPARRRRSLWKRRLRTPWTCARMVFLRIARSHAFSKRSRTNVVS